MDLILLQADGQGSMLAPFIFPLLIFAVIWMFMIRPNQVKQKKLLESLEAGQEIMLNSGILGKIVKIDGEIITLAVDEKTKIRVVRSAVSNIVPA